MKNNPDHGNRLRTVTDAYEAKKDRSKKAYASAQLSINPFWLNEKLIRDMVNMFGDGCIVDPKEMHNEGFDLARFSSERIINNETVFIMNKHAFSITDKKLYKLWKL